MSTTSAAARLLGSRRLMRAPIWIFKARAGALLGPRLLMLEHIGRKSNARRDVVLEVVAHPTPETFLVASGFGGKAQWFRNIRANPHVRVHVGSHSPARATARTLDQHETDTALAAYRDRHPRAWARFKPVLEQTLGTSINDTTAELPLVELRLD
ncbi:MAG TPA: nitroreductase family deazaflavin-dependent oxidoreductase [Mycobacterium sp.]|nr:nitroreductase family deazaflavin-dependent oxidoreductase [Mycobacterium sp.]